jgi:hypothetical protein
MRLRGTPGPNHRHLIGITSVVIVAAAATGGYVASAHTGSSAIAGHTGRTRVAGVSSVSTANAPTPSDEGGATGSVGSSAIACPMIPAATDPTGPGVGIGSATHIFTRTTADGVTIRTYRLPASGPCDCGPLPVALPSGTATSGTATSGPAVLTEGAVSVELSDDTAVGQGTLLDGSVVSATTANADTEAIDPVSDAFGVVEGAPVWWTAMSVASDVASAQMTFADGSTDQMVPVDGVVVLAHHIDTTVASSGAGPDVVRGTLRLLDSSGAVLTTVSVPLPTPMPQPGPPTFPGSPPMTISSSAAAASSNAAAAASSIHSSSPVTAGAMVACPDPTAPDPSSSAVTETH